MGLRVEGAGHNLSQLHPPVCVEVSTEEVLPTRVLQTDAMSSWKE